MVAIFICCYAVPLPGDILIRLFDLDANFTWEMGKVILAIAGVLLPEYILLCIAMGYFNMKHGAYWERKFGALDDRMRVKLK